MLKRKIEKDIIRWIDEGDKALALYGVRQSGKTFVIRECLRKKGCDWIEFNLIEQKEIVNILQSSESTDDLILKLSLYTDKKIIPGKTIFFFDEIQKYREIVTRIKFLVEDGRFRYILSGSLLGVEINNLKSAPVGYLETLTLYPLDFEEFMQLFDNEGRVVDNLRSAYRNRIPVDDVIHRRMLEIFNLYLIIGGMPAAVEKYRTTGDINAVMTEHSSIIEQYKVDFTQYETEDRKLMITDVYENIPSELNEKNKRFRVSELRKNLRYERIEDSFVWLWKAGVALGVFNTTEPTVPLRLNGKNSLFKLFLSDVGLLTTLYGKACKLKIVSDDGDMNRGAVYENAVAQELKAHGYELYYYNSKKKGELDFVIEQSGRALPLEIKSGKDYERHSALDNVTSTEEYGIEEAFVFSRGNVRTEGKIVYYPIYMIMFLSQSPQWDRDISLSRYSFNSVGTPM